MGQRVNDGRAEQPLIERIKREQRRYEIAREVLAAMAVNWSTWPDGEERRLQASYAVAMADALLAALEAPDGR